MTDSGQLVQVMDDRVRRRSERREFFKNAMSAGVLAAGGFAALGMPQMVAAQTAVTDQDILNLALNLEYLEAQFYSYAANGVGLPEDQLTGTVGTRGQVTGGRKAALSDRGVIQYAREIAQDEAAHVASIRAVLGTARVAQPALDISVTVFTAAARAAGIDLTASGGVFDPYASDDNFLLGAYIFEDVGVTAYKGAAPLITDVAIVDAAAGILAAEAFHSGIIRSTLYRRGVATPVLRTNADRISDARDSLDGATDLDQGISPVTLNTAPLSNVTAANIVPTDQNGVAFSRTPEQVHNIVYLTRTQVTAGGFFPNGTNNANAALRRSGAN